MAPSKIEIAPCVEVEKKLNREAILLEIRSASKLVQDVLIKIDGEWTPIQLYEQSRVKE